MRKLLFAVWLVLASIASAGAEVAVSIGINVPVYPQLAVVPGYPVYYAPRLGANYFFYDGAFWVFVGDNWYMSSWYNGPWTLVGPEAVPVFILRVPVRYYYQRPAYFYGWWADAPPRWGEHWGSGWAQNRVGWDRWNRASAPRPAPLPAYQRQYAGNRYPLAQQQYVIQSRNYRYQPRDAMVRQQFAALRTREASTAAPRLAERAPATQAARPRTEQARSAPVTVSRATPAHASPAAPRVAAPTQSASAAKAPRAAPEQRNPVRHEPAVTAKASRPAPEQRSIVRRESPVNSRPAVAHDRPPATQRAQPPQREAAEAPRHIAANVARTPAAQHQPPQHAEPQHAAPPRAPNKGQERERE